LARSHGVSLQGILSIIERSPIFASLLPIRSAPHPGCFCERVRKELKAKEMIFWGKCGF
jgi:hypothetical protein